MWLYNTVLSIPLRLVRDSSDIHMMLTGENHLSQIFEPAKYQNILNYSKKLQ
jgi:hypothetical protein